MIVFGQLPDPVREPPSGLRVETAGLVVGRRDPGSDTPFPIHVHVNFGAAPTALAFAESFMQVDALVALPYDWQVGGADRWTLQRPDKPREAIASADRRAGLRELSRLTEELGGHDAELKVGSDDGEKA